MNRSDYLSKDEESRTTFFIQDVNPGCQRSRSAFFLPNDRVVKWHDLSASFKTVAEKSVYVFKEVSVEVSTIPYTVVLEEGFFEDCDMLEDICTLKDCIATTVFPEKKRVVNGVRKFLEARKSK